MKKIILASSLLFLAGCAGVIQMGSVSDAYKSYERQKYEKTLKLISQAESIRPTTRDLKAELTYLKAQTYEGMGDAEKAETLYEYLRDQHGDSQYGYLANERLGGNHASSH